MKPAVDSRIISTRISSRQLLTWSQISFCTITKNGLLLSVISSTYFKVMLINIIQAVLPARQPVQTGLVLRHFPRNQRSGFFRAFHRDESILPAYIANLFNLLQVNNKLVGYRLNFGCDR